MSFWNRNLIHKMAYRVPAGRDANGDTVTGTVVQNVACKVDARKDVVRGPDNNEVVSSHRIFTNADVPLNAAIWIPHLGDVVGNESQARFPLTVARPERLRGGGAENRLTTVYL